MVQARCASRQHCTQHEGNATESFDEATKFKKPHFSAVRFSLSCCNCCPDRHILRRSGPFYVQASRASKRSSSNAPRGAFTSYKALQGRCYTLNPLLIRPPSCVLPANWNSMPGTGFQITPVSAVTCTVIATYWKSPSPEKSFKPTARRPTAW